MFAPYCPEHESRVLLFVDNIEAIERTGDGLRIHYRCNCGHRGVWAAGAPRGLAA